MFKLPKSLFRKVWAPCLLGLTLWGCATVPMASVEEDLRVKNLAPPPDAALIYLYRNEFAGYAIHMDVSLDGIPAGQTVWDSFMVWEVSPGQHYLLSHAENDSMIPLFVQPGRRYFVWQEVKMGLFMARSELQLVPEPKGLSGVNDCKLVQMRSYPRRAPIPAPPPAPMPPPAPAPGGAAAPPTS